MYNNLWQQASRETEGEYEYIVGQLLEMAKILDYADEIGRRKMFMLLRESFYCIVCLFVAESSLFTV